MITLEQYQEKKAKIDKVKADITRLEGSEDQMLANLKKDFGVAIVDLMFLDHSAATYVSDVDVASSQNFLATGA